MGVCEYFLEPHGGTTHVGVCEYSWATCGRSRGARRGKACLGTTHEKLPLNYSRDMVDTSTKVPSNEVQFALIPHPRKTYDPNSIRASALSTCISIILKEKKVIMGLVISASACLPKYLT